MRKIFVFGVMTCFAGQLCAQQIGQYTHFMFNYFHINPAMAGTQKCPDIRLGHRTQWVGFEDQPRTVYASAHGAIMGKSKINKSKHGIGGMVESDATGPLGRTSLYLAYAYHFQFNRKWMMSAGFFLGFQQYRFDVSEVFVEDFNDPALQGSSTSFIFPDITPGIYFYDKSWTFGVAVAHIIGNPIPNLGTTSIEELSGGSRLRRHVSIMASRRFGDTDKFSYTPAVLLRFVSASVPAIDLNFIAEYKSRIGLGVSYRNGDALAALMQVRFLKYFALAYAFDFTTSRVRIASSNTHEITLGISICPRGTEQGRIPCAAYR
jgi:type IX secretion system PorP/SprF family membrane protein